MIKCKKCVYKTFAEVTVTKEKFRNLSFFDIPEGTEISHVVKRLHCALYPIWKEVESEHFCGKGKQAKSIVQEESEK